MAPVLFLTLLASASGAAAPDKAEDVKALCARHEAGIRRLIEARDPAGAIRATSEYERDLTDRYPAPKWAAGLFRSEAHGLQFALPFARAWKPAPKDPEQAASYATMGVDLLATLKGPTDAENVILMCMDMDLLTRRVGMSGEKTLPSLLTLSKNVAARMGNVEDQRSVKLPGGQEAVRMRLSGERAVELTSVKHGGRVFILIVTGDPETQQEEVGRRLDEWVGALKFGGGGAAAAKVAAAREKAAAGGEGADGNGKLLPLLASAGEIAAMGQYRDAVIQLADLRAGLARTLPKPVVAGKDLVHESYGLSLKNPDAERFKPQVLAAGSLDFMVFEDTTSVSPAMFGVMVMDPLLIFGPSMRELDPAAPEESVRGMLSSMGRGGLLNVGTKLERERFRKFKGRLTYEGVATAKIPNTKVKALLVRGDRALYMFLLLGPEQNLAEFEGLLEAGATLKDAAAPAGRLTPRGPEN